jgi:hypothetical protein
MESSLVEVLQAAGKPGRKKLSEEFKCKFLNRHIMVSDCMDNYVNANALNIKNSPCFKCGHGLKIRMGFAQS